MTIDPADMATRIAVFQILLPFTNDWGSFKGWQGDLRDTIYASYWPDYIPPKGLQAQLSKYEDVDMRDKKLFVYLEPSERNNLLPLLTIHTSSNWVHFRAYALLNVFDEDSKLRTLGIRFETDEGEGDSHGTGDHDFCHAQFFKELGSGSRLPIPPWLPDSQPSFPLDADDQVSLILCMLVSLYGGDYVRTRLKGEINLRKYLDRPKAVRGRQG